MAIDRSTVAQFVLLSSRSSHRGSCSDNTDIRRDLLVATTARCIRDETRARIRRSDSNRSRLRSHTPTDRSRRSKAMFWNPSSIPRCRYHFRIRPCGRWWCCHPQGRYCSWSICTYDAFGENLRILDLLPLAGISSSRTSQIRSILCQLPSIVTSRKIPRATSFVEERAVQGYPKRIKNMKRKGKSHQYNGRIS